MARQRLVAPEFFAHKQLFQAERTSGLPLRLAYIGLWGHADRRGCFEWTPDSLEIAILPRDGVDFGAVLAALESAGFVRSYEVAGRRYGVIPTFARWQTFHHKENPNRRIPDPPGTLVAAPEATVPPGGDPGSARGQPGVGPTGTGTGTGTDASASQSAADAHKQTRANGEGYPWMAQVRAVHHERYDADPAKGTGRLLAPLVNQHGIEEVAARYRRYCAATEGRYFSASKFATTWGEWAETPVGANNTRAAGHSPEHERAARLYEVYARTGLCHTGNTDEQEAIATKLVADGIYRSVEAAFAEWRITRPTLLANLNDDRARVAAIRDRLLATGERTA